MKKQLTFTLMILLVSLLAAGVYAQSESNAGDQPKNNNQVRSENRTGEATQTGDNVRVRTRSTDLDGDKTGSDGNNELGNNRRHDDENTGDGDGIGNGPMDHGDDLKVMGEECEGDRTGDTWEYGPGGGFALGGEGSEDFGPNMDVVGHGARTATSGSEKTTAALESRGQRGRK